MSGIRLIAGLGNPGREYEATRHNAGFWWVDHLADSLGAAWQPEARYNALCARATVAGHEVRLVKPQTFMNLSGRAVGALAHFYRIAPAEILVAHDELDLPPGAARLKKGGGPGGHNGLKDIIAHLGSNDFWRLRLGIGHPGDRGQVHGHVLGMPPRAEAELIGAAVTGSLWLAPRLAAGDFEAAMRELHSARPTNGNKP